MDLEVSRYKLSSTRIPEDVVPFHLVSFDIEVTWDGSEYDEYTPELICGVWVCRCGQSGVYVKSHLGTSPLYKTYTTSGRALMAMYIDMKQHCESNNQRLLYCSHNGWSFDMPVSAEIIRSSSRDSSIVERMFRSIRLDFKDARSLELALELDVDDAVHIDTYYYCLRAFSTRFKSYKLSSIADDLGLQSKLNPMKRFTYRDDPTSLLVFIDYCVVDCKLVLDIVSKLEIDVSVWSISQLVGCDPSIVARRNDGMMATYAITNTLVDSCGPPIYTTLSTRLQELDIEGGYVMQTDGIMACNTYLIDFCSLYASIMEAGVSPDSIVPSTFISPINEYDETESMECIVTSDDSVDGYRRVLRYNYHGWIVEYDTSIGGVTGTFSKLCKSKRKVCDRDGNRVKGLAYKLLANCVYGGMSNKHLPYFNSIFANCVTMTGRISIQIVQLIVSGMGMNVIYGDTDSIFASTVHGNGKSKRSDMMQYLVSKTIPISVVDDITSSTNNANAMMSRLLETLASTHCMVANLVIAYLGFPTIRIEPERKGAAFRNIAILKKKRYIGVSYSGVMTRTGVATVRRDCSSLARYMTTIIETMVTSPMSVVSFLSNYEHNKTGLLLGSSDADNTRKLVDRYDEWCNAISALFGFNRHPKWTHDVAVNMLLADPLRYGDSNGMISQRIPIELDNDVSIGAR